MNGKAVTDKGTFTLNKNKPPYISFEYAPKKTPEYNKLRELFEEYGLVPVDNAAKGGSLWVSWGKYEDLMKDFVRDCQKLAVSLIMLKKLRHYRIGMDGTISVEPKHLDAYKKSLKKTIAALPSKQDKDVKDPVLALIEKSGFPYC